MKLAHFQEWVLLVWASFAADQSATSYRILLCGTVVSKKEKKKSSLPQQELELRNQLWERTVCVDQWVKWSEGALLYSLCGNWLSHCRCLNATCQPCVWGAHYWLCYNLLRGARAVCKQERRNFWKVNECVRTSWLESIPQLFPVHLVSKDSEDPGKISWYFKYDRLWSMLQYMGDYVLTVGEIKMLLEAWCSITPKLKGKNNLEY